MPNVVNGGNGLLSSTSVAFTGADDSNIFVRLGQQNVGNLSVAGDITAGGDVVVGDTLFGETIQVSDVSLNPLYLKNPNNLGSSDISMSAVIIEGGANRTDVSGLAVMLATYKPFTRGTIDHAAGEQVGVMSFWGKDLSGANARYGEMRAVCTDPTTLNKQGRLNFLVQNNNTATTLLQIDGSQNIITSLNNATFKVNDGANVFSVPCNYSAEVSTGGGTAMPLNATTSTFTPAYTGTYAFEMTYLFDTVANGGVINNDNVLGFRVSGAGNDYGAVVAGKAITLPASGDALPYTISSLHQLTAGTAYTITYVYLGTAGAKGGTAGGYVLEANLV